MRDSVLIEEFRKQGSAITALIDEAKTQRKVIIALDARVAAYEEMLFGGGWTTLRFAFQALFMPKEIKKKLAEAMLGATRGPAPVPTTVEPKK